MLKAHRGIESITLDREVRAPEGRPDAALRLADLQRLLVEPGAPRAAGADRPHAGEGQRLDAREAVQGQRVGGRRAIRRKRCSTRTSPRSTTTAAHTTRPTPADSSSSTRCACGSRRMRAASVAAESSSIAIVDAKNPPIGGFFVGRRAQRQTGSASSSTPKRASTSRLIAFASSSTSAPVAPPRFTSTSACRSCTAAPPIARPFQPHRSISQPAASLTRPSGCRYDTTSGSRCLQRFESLRAHHRILEETARVAEHLPVGQLGAAARRRPHRRWPARRAVSRILRAHRATSA